MFPGWFRMLPLSPNSRPEDGSLPKPKRSRAGASHPRPNLRAPLLPSCPGLPPYDSPQPVPSSSFLDNPDALLDGLRCFTAFRPLPQEHHVFINPTKKRNSPLLGDTLILRPSASYPITLIPNRTSTPRITGKRLSNVTSIISIAANV